MAKYRKLPVEIEAHPVADICAAYSGTLEPGLLPEWVVDGVSSGEIRVDHNSITVDTLEGNHVTDGTDMLIRGVKGELCGCKLDIFDATYERLYEDQRDRSCSKPQEPQAALRNLE